MLEVQDLSDRLGVVAQGVVGKSQIAQGLAFAPAVFDLPIEAQCLLPGLQGRFKLAGLELLNAPLKQAVCLGFAAVGLGRGRE